MQVQAVLAAAKQFAIDRAPPINLNYLNEVQHPSLLAKNIEPVDDIEPEDEEVGNSSDESAKVTKDESAKVTEDLPVVITEEEKENKWLAQVSERLLFAQAAWNGVYSGLYGMKTKKGGVQKPTDECFGEWIVDDAKLIRNFFRSLRNHKADFKDFESAWYSTGDLMFKNEDVCHFGMVLKDLKAWCEVEDVSKK